VCDDCWVPLTCIIHEKGIRDIDNRYTIMYYDNVAYPAHQLAAFSVFGRFPGLGEQVLHRCDRKCCCCPRHVRLGTGRENTLEAIIRGLFTPTFPSGSSKGEKNGRAILSDDEAAWIKWLLANKTVWFTSALREHHSAEEALAIHFRVTVAVIRRTKRRESWAHVGPVRPESLPDEISVPADAKPLVAHGQGLIGAANVKTILLAYPASSDKHHFVRNTAAQYGVSTNTIRAILSRKIYKHVHPEIPPVDFSKVGNILYSTTIVQSVRATWSAYEGSKKGLIAALARRFHCTLTHIIKLISRHYRPDIPDDPSAAIPLGELQFKDLTQHGSKHPRAKLSEDQALEILRALNAGTKVAFLAKKYGVSEPVIYKIRRGEGYPVAQARFRAEQAHSGEAQA